MQLEEIRAIPADHPSLRGHFPGVPIVPGVVILDEVASLLDQWKSGCRIVALPAVKFLSVLKPEQVFTISVTVADESSAAVADFCCRAADRVIASGRLEIAGC